MATHTAHKSTADGKERSKQLRDLRRARQDRQALDAASFRRMLRGER